MSQRESAAGKPDGKKPDGNRSGGRRRILIWVAVCVVVTTAVISSLRIKQRVEHDTAFCTTSCHHENDLSKDGAWHATGHKDLQCQSCHASTMGTGFKLYWQSLVGTKQPVAHGKATARACTSCHEKQPADWRVIAETRGHREHNGVKNVDCLSCHASGTHKTVEPAAVCVTCHKDERLHKTTTANAETCLSCHGYTASQKNAQQPSTIVCEKCHADQAALTTSAGATPPRVMNDVNAHVIHGGVACQLCHNAHGKKVTPPAGQVVCAKCHQFEMFQVGSEDRKGPEGHR
ncbi:MAG TPA: cytochrome c3 family protein, partial [Polyangiaceae bacterium]